MKKADKNLLSGSTTLLVLSLLSSGDKYGYEMPSWRRGATTPLRSRRAPSTPSSTHWRRTER